MSGTLRVRLNRSKKIYIRLLLWVLGRSIPRALRLFPAAEAEARNFPRAYRILLGLRDPGPALILESDGTGGLYRTQDKETAPDLEIRFTSTEAAFRLFTFRESTAASEAGGRLIVKGSLALVLSFIRIIDAVEILLLPRFIAQRAVKRWKKPDKLLFKRSTLYLGLILPAPTWRKS